MVGMHALIPLPLNGFVRAGTLRLSDGHQATQKGDNSPPLRYLMYVGGGCVGGRQPDRGVARAVAAATVAHCTHRPTAVVMHARHAHTVHSQHPACQAAWLQLRHTVPCAHPIDSDEGASAATPCQGITRRSAQPGCAWWQVAAFGGLFNRPRDGYLLCNQTGELWPLEDPMIKQSQASFPACTVLILAHASSGFAHHAALLHTAYTAAQHALCQDHLVVCHASCSLQCDDEQGQPQGGHHLLVWGPN